MLPKMDYDEWTPLGRGNPLKNDPTFDYSPPMVSKVKYWINPLLRTPDPPIIPNKEATTETSQYTATITTLTKSNSISKQSSSSDIKRLYTDFIDPIDMSYAQALNSKYNNLIKGQHISYQNQYYTPTRQPPPPLPMLVPPPPVEPHSYSSNNTDNSTSLELSWDLQTQTTSSVPTTNAYTEIVTTVPTSITVNRIISINSKTENRPEIKTTSHKSILQNLLGKEKSKVHQVTYPTITVPLTPNPTKVSLKQYNTPVSPRLPTYLIIQGHSKVKKYGTTKTDRSDHIFMQDTNDINDIMKYELPKDIRSGKQLSLEDFLPMNTALRETLKDIITNKAEGSGFGAELTKAIFPSYIRPSTTLVYESPRMYDYNEEVNIQES